MRALSLQKSGRRAFSRREGFTLIELLVVVSIIAILASILFPVFARARENARRASCMSNLRQLGLGIQQYTQDYDERLPNAWVGPSGENKIGGWVFYSVFSTSAGQSRFDVRQGSLQPYLKSAQIFVCPSDTSGGVVGDSYAINSCALSTTGDGLAIGKNLAAFDDTARWMLLSEEGRSGDNSFGTDDGYQLIKVNDFSARHLEGSNLAFLDGHVKWYRVEKLKADYLQTGGTVTASCP